MKTTTSKLTLDIRKVSSLLKSRTVTTEMKKWRTRKKIMLWRKRREKKDLILRKGKEKSAEKVSVIVFHLNIFEST